MTHLSDYHVRLARDEDLSALPDIERAANALFADYGLAEQLSDLLTPIESLREGVKTDRLWVAADKADRPIGFALAAEIDGNAHLDEIDVHPAHGRRGLGAALVAAVCDWAAASGYDALTLTTLRHIPWNAPWYQRLGFRVLEENELSQALRELLQIEIQRGLPADQRVVMRREIEFREDLAMPEGQPQERPILDIETQLGLPPGFLLHLYQKEDDWSFVIKTHAFLEAVLTHLLAEYLGKPDLLPVFAYLETSNVRTGKLAFVRAFDLLDKGARRFVHTLSELRNTLVHDVSNVNFRFTDYVSQLTEREQKDFVGAFDYAFAEVAQANQWPAEQELSSTIDRIVLTAPRLAIIAGTAMIGLDIYYRNRDAATRRAAVLRMAEIIVGEWRGLQV